MPVFSFEKIRGADISLGPEMKSTGECLGIAKTFDEALYKAFLGAGINLPKHKNMIITVKDSDKLDVIDIARRFEAIGYRIFSTRGTARALQEHGVHARMINKIEGESPNLMDLILGHEIKNLVNRYSVSGCGACKRRIPDPTQCDRDRCQRTDRTRYGTGAGSRVWKIITSINYL